MLKHLIAFATFFLILNGLCAQPPKAAVNAYKKGMMLKDKGMYAESLQSFRNALSFYKKYDSALVEMGNIYFKGNKPDSAALYFGKALVINPKQANAYTGFGNINRDVKANYDEALKNYYAAIRYDSSNKETFYSIAWCYNTKKLYDSAILYAIRSLQIDNNYRPGYSELGHAYHASKKYREAIEQFKKNLAISVNEQPLLYSGLCYIELKDKNGATDMYNQLVRLQSKMADALKKKIDEIKE